MSLAIGSQRELNLFLEEVVQEPLFVAIQRLVKWWTDRGVKGVVIAIPAKEGDPNFPDFVTEDFIKIANLMYKKGLWLYIVGLRKMYSRGYKQNHLIHHIGEVLATERISAMRILAPA